jgi:hypothetical protein
MEMVSFSVIYLKELIKMEKYIFLDIDGVLATPKSIEGVGGEWKMEDEKQELLKHIIDSTGAKIVLSSSWRKWDIESTIEFMKEEGFWFSDLIVGVTIRAYQYLDRTKKIHLSIPRGVEIYQWIDTNIHSDNGINYERKKLGVDYQYVILDDDIDMLYTQKNNFVNTNSDLGLTKTDCEIAIEVLNRKYDF